MRNVLTLLIFAAVAAVAPQRTAEAADEVGVGTLTVQVPERGGTMDSTLWYPAGPGGQTMLIAENALFRGVSASQNAPAIGGSHPLVLLSQGGLRSGPNIGAWMASRLAMRGFVVAMLRQPDPHSQSPQKTLEELWLRPADISATLTAIENDASLIGRIDPNKVGVLGFQIGGTAALALAGARLDPSSFAHSCDPGGTEVDCAWFAKAGVDLHAVDAVRLARSSLDRRIKAVFVIDPELSTNFTAASLADISLPVRVVNLGSPKAIWPGLNASALAQALSNAQYETVADATQFSSFPECKPQAAATLGAEGEEPLCDDAGGQSRAEIHDQLAAMVAAAFRVNLSR
jgi:predicted dienelactone hydrolase